MRLTTLRDICKQIKDNYQYYDFSSPLQVCVRTVNPNFVDSLAGYTVVEFKDNEFYELVIDDPELELFHDGDYYPLDTKEYFMWQYEHASPDTKPVLYVWIDMGLTR